MANTATIFNIERFSHEDGPGIRTVVFMKGCSLRCKWCANPESQTRLPQILHKPAVCASCGRCVGICPAGCVARRENGSFAADPEKCRLCLACVDGCYAGARELMGEEYTVERLFAEVMKDAPYYHASGGGVTFSGGEPVLQADFIAEFAARAAGEGFGILLETCGQAAPAAYKKLSGIVDAVYFDFKHIDSGRHRELTGGDNRLILENLRWLDAHFSGLLAIRYPYIPGMNDDPAAIERFIEFAAGLKRVAEVWFLPYHRLGLSKYHGLGLEYPMGDAKPLRMGDIEFLRKYQDRLAVPIRI